jgi:23S rRNA pseudouridine1911/1915/1917 synthase
MVESKKEKEDEIEFFQIVIPENTLSTRVDKFLSEYSGYSRSRISNYTYKLLINNKEEKLSKIIKPKDLVQIYLKIPDDYTEIIPQKYDLDIIYEDDLLIVIKKPFNVPTHPSFGHSSDTILNYIKYYLLNKNENPLPDCGMVHRLDKDTEGLLIFAKTIESQAYLKFLFMNRQIEKNYFAIIKGIIEPKFAEFNDKLKRDPNDRLKYKVCLSGKEAILSYSRIGVSSDYSALDINLKTGRTHQIRVQFSYRGHFVIGDPIYGKKQNKIYEEYGMLLLSKRIRFVHPKDKKFLEFEIDLPQRFKKFINDYKIILEG